MGITELSSDEAIKAVLEGKHLYALYFYASWAQQCEQITTPVINMLANDPINDAIHFYIADAEKVQKTCEQLQVSSVPTVICFSDGKQVGKVQGTKAAEITLLVSGLLNQQQSVTADEKRQLDLKTRLKSLINRSRVMLFMKGSPDAVRCGFSKQIIAILREQGIQFDTFDILSDEEVRQGLKKYSDWPTYPQLYANGELIGGVDIVREMAEANELVSVLNP